MEKERGRISSGDSNSNQHISATCRVCTESSIYTHHRRISKRGLPYEARINNDLVMEKVAFISPLKERVRAMHDRKMHTVRLRLCRTKHKTVDLLHAEGYKLIHHHNAPVRCSDKRISQTPLTLQLSQSEVKSGTLSSGTGQ